MQFKTTPRPYQLEDHEASKDLPGVAFPWPPRLGKSWMSINGAAYHALEGRVDAGVVIAPNGVHFNWSREEIPRHWPLDEPLILEWDTSKTDRIYYQRQLDRALAHEDFVWFVLNVEALGSSKKLVNLTKSGGMGYLEKFVRKRKCFLTCDESIDLADPYAKRTRSVLKIAPLCPYRRILDGTMEGRGPFGLWSQYRIIDKSLLAPCYPAHRVRYGIFRRANYGGKSFDELVEYQRLNELRTIIAPVTFRRDKKKCLPDLPRRDKPERRYFVLPAEHRRVYDELKEKYITELADGLEVTASQAIVRLLRLEQISRGHVTDAEKVSHRIPGPRPAAELTARMIAANDRKVMVWCRFVPDIEILGEALTERGIEYIRYDGSVPKEERHDLRLRFNDFGDGSRAVLCTTGTGGRGGDWPAADTIVYYSHSYDYVKREQSLERNYGASQEADQCFIVDLVAADTHDLGALQNLVYKDGVAAKISGRDILKEVLK